VRLVAASEHTRRSRFNVVQRRHGACGHHARFAWKVSFMAEGGTTSREVRRSAARRASWVLTFALAACTATDPPIPAPAGFVETGQPHTSIAVVQRDWHTDVCLRVLDLDAWVITLAHGFDGATVLCFGFGERQYVVERRHDPLTMIGAMFPSRAAILMTVLRATPEEAFGAQNVIEAPLGDAGLDRIQRFLRESIETDTAGDPLRLADGPYPGSLFFAASGTYDVFHTCNTWTARALRSAGLTNVTDTVFSGSLMREVRAAVARTKDAPH
jgi:uncharacterized protein (TIGR02117 family)